VLENSWHTLLKLVTTFSKLGLKAEKEKIVKTMQTNQISQTRISLLHPIHQDLPHRSILSYDDEELLRIRCSEDRSHLKMSQPKAGMRREQGKNQVDGLLRKTGSNALEFLRLIFASETENENIHQFNLVQRGRAKIRHERDQIWTMGTSRVDKLKNVIKHGALTQPTNEKKKKKKSKKRPRTLIGRSGCNASLLCTKTKKAPLNESLESCLETNANNQTKGPKTASSSLAREHCPNNSLAALVDTCSCANQQENKTTTTTTEQTFAKSIAK
jgi:hypothetical protein